MFGTKFIWEASASSFMSFILRFLWLVALSYDLYTSYHGKQHFILGGNVNNDQMVMIIGMTILVSGAPIIFSYLVD